MEEPIEWLPPPVSKHIGWSWGWIWGWSGTLAWILGSEQDLLAISASCLSPPLLCYVMPRSQHVHTQQTDERGGGLEKSYAFFSLGQRRLCAVVGLLAHSKKKNAMEWPLHEPPQKVGAFSDIIQSPQFWPPVPFFIVLFFNLIISPLLYPCHNPVCSLCFYSGSTMGS